MKNLNKMSYQICRLLALLVLIGGFLLESLWWGALIAFAFGVFYLLSQRFLPKAWSGVRLIAYAGIAVFALLFGVSPVPLVIVVTASLACWDMEDHLPGPEAPSLTAAYEKEHLRWLAIASLTGIVLAETVIFINFKMSFGVLLLTALIVLFFIYRLFTTLKNTPAK